jgi:hypothetical protein
MTNDASEAGGIPGKRSLRPLGGVLAAMAVSLTGTRISVVALPPAARMALKELARAKAQS